MIIADTPEIREMQDEIERRLKESNEWMDSLTPEELDFDRWDPLDEAYDNEIVPQRYKWYPKTKEDRALLGIPEPTDLPPICIDDELDMTPEEKAFMELNDSTDFETDGLDDETYGFGNFKNDLGEL